MSADDILWSIFCLLLCVYVIGSFVFMTCDYKCKMRRLDYIRHIIRLQEYEIIEKTEEVKG